MNTKNEKPTISVPEAARRLGVCPASAYSYAKQGLLPHIRLGRRILVLRSGIERLLSEGSDGRV